MLLGFGIFNVVGTPNNLAIRDTLNQDCVPQLYAATGAALWGNPDEFPFTVGSLPTYATEMGVFVQYLEDNTPDAKVAVLYQNDDFGKEYLDSITELTAGTDIEIVAEESYEPSDSDVAHVTVSAATGPETGNNPPPTGPGTFPNTGGGPVAGPGDSTDTGTFIGLAILLIALGSALITCAVRRRQQAA